jgi:hypothetical protein
LDDVIMGQREWASVFEPHTIAIRCAKHRLDGEKRNQDVHLYCRYGRISDEPPDHREPSERGDAWEGPAGA